MSMLGLSLVVAQQGPSATRSFDTASVAPGGQVEVTIAASGLRELRRSHGDTARRGSATSPLVVSTPTRLRKRDRPCTFILQEANKSFTYTVTASGTGGTYNFSGQLRDSDRVDRNVGGAASVTVTAGSTTSGARATRSFDTASVAPGGQVEVTIAASGLRGLRRSHGDTACRVQLRL